MHRDRHCGISLSGEGASSSFLGAFDLAKSIFGLRRAQATQQSGLRLAGKLRHQMNAGSATSSSARAA
jgi:hypothetical protein